MKMLLLVVLIASGLLELLAALSLIAGPGGISEPGLGEQWSMHYGFAALAIASVSVWCWFQRSHGPALTVALGTLLVFHAGLTVSLAVAGDQQGGLVSHAVLAVLVAVLFAQRGKLTG